MVNRSGLVLILLVLAAGAIGWYLGYEQGVGKTKTQPAGAGVSPAADIRALTGVVKSVSGNTIVVNATSFLPPGSSESDARTVVTLDSTRIERLKQKDAADFEKEMDAYNAEARSRTSSTSTPLMPPELFTRENISVSDIKSGETVNITASENIASAKRFTAASVTVSVPASPAAGTAGYGTSAAQGIKIDPFLPEPQQSLPLPAHPSR